MLPVRTLVTSVCVCLALLACAGTHAAHIAGGVHRTLRAQGAVDVIVTLTSTSISALRALEETAPASTSTSRGERIETLVNYLETHAETSQRELAGALMQESASDAPLYLSKQSFWITNQVYFQGASAELVARLGKLSSVAQVREEVRLPFPRVSDESAPVIERNGTSFQERTKVEWGVQKIEAPAVWASGVTGAGVVVGGIDSGVLSTHEALKGSFMGEYGWFDPETKRATPYDIDGHGTHTMGTIVGSKGIGVAPGATWLACKGCRVEECTEADLLACAQFMTCPTDTEGKKKQCNKAPHVINNSWGGGQGDDFFRGVVATWRRAGIIPVFANGNDGPKCGTANSPADYENVIAVGATTVDDAVADFSSKGPAISGLLKPELSAPGDEVRSAWHTGKRSYRAISGTSMATPHVTGAIALMLQADPSLDYDRVLATLVGTAEQASLQTPDRMCENDKRNQFPNNSFGHGRINVARALSGSTQPSDQPSPRPTPTRRPSPRPTQSPSPTQDPSNCERFDIDECDQMDHCEWNYVIDACVPW